jgi:hypothetical protein
MAAATVTPAAAVAAEATAAAEDMAAAEAATVVVAMAATACQPSAMDSSNKHGVCSPHRSPAQKLTTT